MIVKVALTVQELEAKIGCKLYTKREFGRLIGVSSTKFDPFFLGGFLKNYCYYTLNEDYVVPGVSRKPQFLFPETSIDSYRMFFEENDRRMSALRNNNELIDDVHLGQYLGYSLKEILEEIESGIWDEYIADKGFAHKAKRTIYFFHKDAYKNTKYCSIKRLHEFIEVGENVPYLYYRQGKLTQPEHLIGSNRWDIEIARLQIAQIKENNFMEGREKQKKLDNFTLLSAAQQQLINLYLKKRQKGNGFLWESKTYYDRVVGKREKDRKRIKEELSKYLIKMIAAKKIEGEENYSIFPSQDESVDRFFTDMTEDEIAGLERKAAKVDLFGITKDDIEKMLEGYNPISEWNVASYIKPFLFFLLSEWESKFPMWEIHLDQEYRLKYYLTRKNLFEATTVLLSREPKTPKEKKRGKAFLVRKEILQVYFAIRATGKRRHPSKMYQRNALMWMIGSFCAIRPMEIDGLRIEHFELDENGFVKKINSDGYGILRVPAEISKGTYSRSHDYGTLVVPNLVNLINDYLIGEIYTRQKTRGVGYLFRGFRTLSNPEMKLNHPISWIKKDKDIFKFLSKEMWESFQFKSSRHTLNNLFDKTGLRSARLNAAKKRAAQIQMRHDVEKTSGNIGDVYYSDDITIRDYISCLDEVLNFPWDLDDLEIWEKAKGYDSFENDMYLSNPYELSNDTTSAFEQAPEKTFVKNDIKNINKQIIDKVMATKSSQNDDQEKKKQRLDILEKEYAQYLRNSAKKLKVTTDERQNKLKELREEIALIKAEVAS
ncbi:hypothetical protein [Neobacillus vireti]|uniref:Tyr recombinase domain-containing protein n=1 Tax=Neobacillus vireti LMG 21834 TaxID=1131730 RepID=A0AB94ILH7_9BACI|nr:hypothetical protein [Neobacillus vireti]ETI67858.1 hypothetical protein BAVI_15256 [Neobacillus vireti LMG 21834]KLT16130.1 hypothetical protein AA980_19390 [Neobacillus vireti]